MAPLLQMTGITKRFPGVVACRDVSFAVEAGEIHGLLGENGAGKSTLVKILYGLVDPDEGRIEIDGREVRIRSPDTRSRWVSGWCTSTSCSFPP
ncbi:MAG: ATP-binding cassette domain-containing protein [Acidimicrobiia bacterium]|nr:ATP-binding cassette domain-containing protein [Acidimicrobiia bacterium]